MVEVIGGSLAGASAALELLRRGREVTVYEKTKFPRHKVCGEFLDGKAVELLGGLGIEGARITEAALVWRGWRRDLRCRGRQWGSAGTGWIRH